jgi:hypothetical protein
MSGVFLRKSSVPPIGHSGLKRTKPALARPLEIILAFCHLSHCNNNHYFRELQWIRVNPRHMVPLVRVVLVGNTSVDATRSSQVAHFV